MLMYFICKAVDMAPQPIRCLWSGDNKHLKKKQKNNKKNNNNNNNQQQNQYVGQTPNQRRMATVCHKYDIRHEVDNPVANNLNLPLDGTFELFPTEQPPILGSRTETVLLRLEREGFCVGFVHWKQKIYL